MLLRPPTGVVEQMDVGLTTAVHLSFKDLYNDNTMRKLLNQIKTKKRVTPTKMDICTFCGELYDQNQVKRSLGKESMVYLLGVCSARCYTNGFQLKTPEGTINIPLSMGNINPIS
jgi:hypothetical protein